MAEQGNNQTTTRTTKLEYVGVDNASDVVSQMKVKIKRDIAEISQQKIALKDPEVKSLSDQLKSLKGKGGIFGSLKDAAGEESGLGQIGKLLKGGGAIAGFAAIAQGLDDISGKAVELKKSFADGNVGAAQIAIGLGESIPVLGRIFSAGQNIRELLTGETAEFERIKERADLINDSLQVQRDLAKEGRAEYEQIAKLTRTINEQIKERALAEPEKTIAAASFAAAQSVDELTKGVDTQIKALQEKAAPTLQQLLKEIDAANKRVDQQRKNVASWPADVSTSNYSTRTAKEEAERRLKDLESEATVISGRYKNEQDTLKQQITGLEQGRTEAVKAINDDANDQMSRARADHDNKEVAAQKAYQDQREKLAADHVARMDAIYGDIGGASMRARGPAWAVAADFLGFSNQRDAGMADIANRARENRPGAGGLFHIGDYLKDRFLSDPAEQLAGFARERSQQSQRLREEQDRNGKAFWDSIGTFLDRTVGKTFRENFSWGSGFGGRELGKATGLPQFKDAGETSGLAAAALERQMVDPLIALAQKHLKEQHDANDILNKLPEKLAASILSLFGLKAAEQ